MCCLVEKVLPRRINRLTSGGNISGYFGGLLSPHHLKRHQKRGEEYIVHGKPVKNTGYTLIKAKRNMFVVDFKLPADLTAFRTRLAGVRKIEAPQAFPRVVKSVPSEDTSELAREFKVLAREWKRDTGFHSSLSAKVTHPAYQRIMAMGKPALPFILRDLQQSSDHWFYALRYIAGKDIAGGTDNVEDAKAAWLKWGYQNDYI